MKKRIERAVAKQKTKQKAKSPVLGWQAPKINNRHGKIFANSEAAKEFNRIHTRIFSRARKLIQEKMHFIEQDKIVTDKNTQLQFKKPGLEKSLAQKTFLP